MADSTSAGLTSMTEPSGSDSSRFRRVMKWTGWSAVGLFFLVIFTLLKLPQDRVRNLINGHIAAALAPYGVTFIADESRLSIGFGISYVMKDVVLNLPPPSDPVKVDRLVVSPSLIALLTARVGADVVLEHGKGELNASVATRGTDASVYVKIEDLDLGKLGLTAALAGVRAGGILGGTVNLSGDFAVPSTVVGNIDLKIDQIYVEPQSIVGFKISQKLSISEARARVAVDKSKANIETLRLGKEGNATDDIRGSGSGDIALSRQWTSSVLNLKTTFALSDNIKKDIFLIDAILAPGKRPDGSYAVNFNGPMNAVMPTPAGAGR
jgi:type II secretion system protein N